MSNMLKDYSSEGVTASWGGSRILGLAENGIEFSRNAAISEYAVGMDGTISVSKLPDKTWTVTVTLAQASPTNDVWLEVVEEQDRTARIVRKDLVFGAPTSGIDLTFRNASIISAPTFSYGSTANGSTRDWVFFVEKLVLRNPSITGAANLAVDSNFIRAQIQTIFNIV